MTKRIIAVFLVCTMVGFVTNKAFAEQNKDYNAGGVSTYAQNYAEDSNGEYYEFGSDCTNFVSQCEKAGGVTYKENIGQTKVNVDIVVSRHICDPDDTYSYWYMKRKKNSVFGYYYYYYTKSWVNVKDFRKYHGYHEATVTEYDNNYEGREKLKRDIKVGDVVQADNKHSIVISLKDGDKINYCGHSNNVLNKEMKSFLIGLLKRDVKNYTE